MITNRRCTAMIRSRFPKILRRHARRVSLWPGEYWVIGYQQFCRITVRSIAEWKSLRLGHYSVTKKMMKSWFFPQVFYLNKCACSYAKAKIFEKLHFDASFIKGHDHQNLIQSFVISKEFSKLPCIFLLSFNNCSITANQSFQIRNSTRHLVRSRIHFLRGIGHEFWIHKIISAEKLNQENEMKISNRLRQLNGHRPSEKGKRLSMECNRMFKWSAF